MKKQFLCAYSLVALFLLVALVRQNMEFIFYAVFLIPLVLLLHKTDAKFKYTDLALWGVCVWMLLHLLGGLATWKGTAWYGVILLDLVGEPYFILKYDQVLHFFCYVVVAMLLGSVVTSMTAKNASTFTVGLVIALAAMGVGGLNEVMEFAAVVFIGSTGVGEYYNTALDIVMNALGAIVGTWAFMRTSSQNT